MNKNYKDRLDIEDTSPSKPTYSVGPEDAGSFENDYTPMGRSQGMDLFRHSTGAVVGRNKDGELVTLLNGPESRLRAKPPEAGPERQQEENSDLSPAEKRARNKDMMASRDNPISRSAAPQSHVSNDQLRDLMRQPLDLPDHRAEAAARARESLMDSSGMPNVEGRSLGALNTGAAGALPSSSVRAPDDVVMAMNRLIAGSPTPKGGAIGDPTVAGGNDGALNKKNLLQALGPSGLSALGNAGPGPGAMGPPPSPPPMMGPPPSPMMGPPPGPSPMMGPPPGPPQGNPYATPEQMAQIEALMNQYGALGQTAPYAYATSDYQTKRPVTLQQILRRVR